MNRENIIQELKNRGYDAISNDVYKNGVKLEAIIIKDDSRITPTIYTEPLFSHANSIEQAADIAERIYLENKFNQQAFFYNKKLPYSHKRANKFRCGYAVFKKIHIFVQIKMPIRNR